MRLIYFFGAKSGCVLYLSIYGTRKSNILDFIFTPDDFINCIDITDSVISDHRIITAKTFIPISPPCQTMSPTCNTFELLDFRKTDWSGTSIKSVNWK